MLSASPAIFRFLLLGCLLFVGISAYAGVKIDIQGADKKLKQNIFIHIGDIETEELNAPTLLERKLRHGVRKASRALGYYQIALHIELKDNKILLQIRPGVAVYFSDSDIHIEGPGKSLANIKKTLSTPPFISGEKLVHQKYEQLKKSLLRELLLQGYLDAYYVNAELHINIKASTAVAKLHLLTGERYYIGQVSFTGSRLDQDLLQKLSPLETGKAVNGEDLLLLRRNLQNSKYFSSVNLQNQRNPDNTLDIRVHLSDANTHQFEAGVGFSTDTGPRVRFSWHQPQLNQSGHSSEVEVKISKPEQEVSGRYMIPLSEPLTHFLQFDAGWLRKDSQDTLSDKSTLGMLITHLTTSDWRMDYSVNLDYEEYIQGSQELTYALYLLPGFGLSKTILPAGIDPLSGSRYWIKAQTSTQRLGSDTDFIRLHGQVKYLFDLGNDNTQLISRLELGAISSEDIEAIPASLRFFTGGDQSVRGYGFEALAPKDADGNLIGGRFLNVASVELSQRFLPHWRAAVFIDSGRSYNDASTAFSTGIGTGIRWLSPIGQIRIDIAFPQDDVESDYQIHISMGPAL
ncbi:MAG: outer membrane protein assembly factor [Pseudomonadales bacterium]|nr:outer membrane protein assembly factor [Pseudomonadales bacterium]